MDLGTFIHIERNLEKYLDQRYVYLKEKKKKKEKKIRRRRRILLLLLLLSSSSSYIFRNLVVLKLWEIE